MVQEILLGLCRNLNNQAQSSSPWRVSGELGISQASVVSHFQVFDKSTQRSQIVHHILPKYCKTFDSHKSFVKIYSFKELFLTLVICIQLNGFKYFFLIIIVLLIMMICKHLHDSTIQSSRPGCLLLDTV